MKKILFAFLVFVALTFISSDLNSSFAACRAAGQDCDASLGLACCNFPNFLCSRGGTGGHFCQANSAQCGNQGQICCEGTSSHQYNIQCASGLTCNASNLCVAPCGGNGQACCTGNTCTDPLARCSSGICSIPAPCGGHQQACCATNPRCSTAGDTCQTASGLCDAAPPSCGGYNEQCCTTGLPCYRPGDSCNAANICRYTSVCGLHNDFCCPVAPICQVQGDACDLLGKCTGAAVICGEHGGLCCSTGQACTVPGDHCLPDNHCGMTGTGSCGTFNGPCCSTNPKCDPSLGQTCNANNNCETPAGTGGGAPNSVNLTRIMDLGLPTFKFKTGNTIGTIVSSLLPIVFVAAGLLLMINLITAGFQLMTSGGNSKATEAAQGKITYSILGFILVFVSWWLIKIAEYVLGLRSGIF